MDIFYLFLFTWPKRPNWLKPFFYDTWRLQLCIYFYKVYLFCTLFCCYFDNIHYDIFFIFHIIQKRKWFIIKLLLYNALYCMLLILCRIYDIWLITPRRLPAWRDNCAFRFYGWIFFPTYLDDPGHDLSKCFETVMR